MISVVDMISSTTIYIYDIYLWYDNMIYITWFVWSGWVATFTNVNSKLLLCKQT